MKAENGKKVKVQFVGRLNDGTIFGEATADKPLEFTLGKEGVIPGFVDALRGMEPGEQKTVQVPPESGFGEHDPDKIISFKRSQISHLVPMTPGAKVVVSDVSGREYTGCVKSFTDEVVKVDMNHPLAGQDLEFEICLQEVA